MFKIINGVLVSALILLASTACSSAPPEEYITVDEYNKLLTRTSDLETRLETLQEILLQDIYILDLRQARTSGGLRGTTGTFSTAVAKTCVKKQNILFHPNTWGVLEFKEDRDKCMLDLREHLLKDIK